MVIIILDKFCRIIRPMPVQNKEIIFTFYQFNRIFFKILYPFVINLIIKITINRRNDNCIVMKFLLLILTRYMNLTRKDKKRWNVKVINRDTFNSYN